MAEDSINNNLKACITFHDVLHILCAVRGTGTAILDIKLSQELTIINQEPLLLVFLDLRKAYETLDQGSILMTLEGYGAGPHMCGILADLWERQEVVTRKNGYHGPQLKATWGTTQGGLILPTLFKMVTNNMVRNWMSRRVEEKLVAHDGLGLMMGQCIGMFYANDGLVWSREQKWLRGSLNMPIGLFRRYGLVANIAKYKSMTCQTVEIWYGMSEEEVFQKSMGRGATYK